MRVWWTKRTLLQKVTVLFVILILLPSAIAIRLIHVNTLLRFREDELASNASTLEAMATDIDKQAALVRNGLEILSRHEEIVTLLSRRSQTPAERVLRQRFEVSAQLSNAQMFLADLNAQILLFTVDEQIPESYYTVLHMRHILANPEYQSFEATGASFGWTGVEWLRPWDVAHNANYNLLTLNCYMRIVEGVNRLVGVLKCGVSPEKLFSELISWSGDGPLFILRGDVCLYAPHSAPDDPTPPAAPVDGSASLVLGDALYLYQAIPELGMTLALRLDEGALRRHALLSSAWQMASVLAAGALLLLLTRTILKSILQRLNQAAGFSQRVQAGDLSIRFPNAGEDEIGRLVQAFNHLLDHIDRQVGELIAREQSERKAQTLALQYQLNPHFLFNTLNWLEMSLEADERSAPLSDSIALLGDFFRYNLSSNPFASLSQEATHMRRYVELMNLRKDNRIELSVDLPDALAGQEVIRLLFQPILENAIKHGMRAAGDLHIAARIRRQEDVLWVEVDNDGLAIPRAQLERIRRWIENAEAAERVGLSNMAARLRLIYGPNAWIRIESDAARTRVTLRLDLTWRSVHGPERRPAQ